MSAKYFCDQCGVELTSANRGGYLQGDDRRIQFFIEVVSDDPEDEFCRYCVLDAVAGLDDRARAA